MDFIDEIRKHKSHVLRQKDLLKDKTEEATKTALINPFIKLLGYDVNDLNEVEPEFIADVGMKKGEKVDYAIKKDGKPIMIFECKPCGADLDKAHDQLYRYFSVTKARVGVLTDGIIYRFYSDIDETNKMDSHPFLEFNLLIHSEDDSILAELKQFTSKIFNVDDMSIRAKTLKCSKDIKRIIMKQLVSPDDDFVDFFLDRLMPRKHKSRKRREELREPLKKALNEFIDERMREKIAAALRKDSDEEILNEEKEDEANNNPDSRIITTDDEWAGYGIIKAILHDIVDLKRVILRDGISQCSILLDDTNRRRICIFYMNDPANMSLGLFDSDGKEKKVKIDTVNDIFKYTEDIRKHVTALIKRYDRR